jgi:long-chain fatty acid transport protein
MSQNSSVCLSHFLEIFNQWTICMLFSLCSYSKLALASVAKQIHKELKIMKLRFLKMLVCIGSLMTLCLQSSTAEAIFASVKATGMAATCIAYPLDTLVAAYNPAGMAMIGDRHDVEAAWVHDTGSLNVHGNKSPFAPLVNGHFKGMEKKDVYPAGFGINKAFCFYGWEMSIGLILYNRNFQKTKYNQPLVLFGTTKAGLEYVNETLAPVWTIKICDRHSFGISANYQIERVKVNGLENFDNAELSLFPGDVTNRHYNWSTGWGYTVGYFGQLTDQWAIGLTYQPETTMRRLHKYRGFLAHKGRLNIPRKIGGGISYRILPCVTMAFDVEFIEWDTIKALRNPLLHKGVLEKLGSRHGPGFGFRNQVYYRVGADWALNDCFTIRAGFRHANSPIRRSQTAVNILTLDTVENYITTGATWAWDACNEISVVYAYGIENRIRGKHSIPASFGGGEADLKERKYAFGAAWGSKF